MITSLDGAAGADEQRRLAVHLAGCVACGREYDETRRLALAIEGLEAETAVPAALEDSLMRRVRTLEAERSTVIERLRAWLPAPLLVAGAAVGIALLVLDVGDRPGGSTASGPIARQRPVDVRPTRVATAVVESATAVTGRPDDAAEAEAVQLASAVGEAAPSEPPVELTAFLPLLLDMPILRHMEKLENFERIESITLLDDGGSNG